MALVGVGKKIRMYDFGKKKLLAKCENQVFFFKKKFNILKLLQFNNIFHLNSI